MLANKRRHRRRRGRMPAPLARYWASHRRNDPNPRHRRHRRAVVRHVVRYRRNPSLVRSFIPSTAALTDFGATAVGMVAPSVVTDRLLPMVGIQLTGWLRRGVQFLVPGVVQYFRLAGRYTPAFVTGGYAVALLGVVNDLTSGIPGMVGGYMRTPAGAVGNAGGYTPFPRRTVSPAAVA